MTSQPTLPTESILGRMPFVDIIYDHCDEDTKKNLKLASKAFWISHIREKYLNNFAKSQEKRHRQLYCFGNFPQTDKYEACFKPPLYTTDRGEICPADEPRTRDGWLIISPPNDDWTKPEQSKKISEWGGCPECWEKFAQQNPEYKICL